MIEIRYNTRVFIDPKTKHVKIRVRWSKNETTFSLAYRADPEKWDNRAQRPFSGTIHKFADQNCSARIIAVAIDEGLEQIKIAFKQCELDSVVPSKERLKTMIRGERSEKAPIKVEKTMAELFEDYLETTRIDKNLTLHSCYKYRQSWNHLNECLPGITLERLTKENLNKLKKWHIDKGYSNVTTNKMIRYLKTFIKWLQEEGYELQPGVQAYKSNLTVVAKTVTFLKYKELMDFYHFKFSEDEKNLELARDMFCFMAFTSLRYSDLSNLKKANIVDDHIETFAQKTRKKVSIPLIDDAKELIYKYKDQENKNGKVFRVYANQKLNQLIKRAAKKAGLDREVMKVYYNGNTRHEEVKKFHEIIGCHDARRTFVCCSLAFKIQPTVVMSCTGHSTYNAMRPYIEVTSETQKNEMEIWNRSEKQSALKNDITKILEGVDEATLIKVLELLKSA